MPAARFTTTAIVVLAFVDAFHAAIFIAAYEARTTVVTHGGSSIAALLDSIVPLRELFPTLTRLLLLTLLITAGAVTNWLSGPAAPGRRPHPWH